MPKEGFVVINAAVPEPLRDAFHELHASIGGEKMKWVSWALYALLEDLDMSKLDALRQRMDAWIADGAPVPVRSEDALDAMERQAAKSVAGRARRSEVVDAARSKAAGGKRRGGKRAAG